MTVSELPSPVCHPACSIVSKPLMAQTLRSCGNSACSGVSALAVGMSGSACKCRATYHLAQYADGLFQGLKAQLASPEHSTAQAIIRLKQQQVRLRLLGALLRPAKF